MGVFLTRGFLVLVEGLRVLVVVFGFGVGAFAAANSASGANSGSVISSGANSGSEPAWLKTKST